MVITFQMVNIVRNEDYEAEAAVEAGGMAGVKRGLLMQATKTEEEQVRRILASRASNEGSRRFHNHRLTPFDHSVLVVFRRCQPLERPLGPSWGPLRDCEIFANLCFEL